MTVVLCFGDSNVWGNIPGSFNPELGLSRRFEPSVRWTGILQKDLGIKKLKTNRLATVKLFLPSFCQSSA